MLLRDVQRARTGRPLRALLRVADVSTTLPGPLLDAEGAAALLNVPKSWVLAKARADRIPHVRLGRYVRFDADDLREWAKERRRGPGVTPRSRRGSPQTRHECREGQR